LVTLVTRTEKGDFGRGRKRDFQAFRGSHMDYPGEEWSKKCIKGGMGGRALRKVPLRDRGATSLHCILNLLRITIKQPIISGF